MRKLRLRKINNFPGVTDFLSGTASFDSRVPGSQHPCALSPKPHRLSEQVMDLRACHLTGGQRSTDIKIFIKSKI